MSLADDWCIHGITVNCLAPGWFKTKQNAVMYENQGWVENLYAAQASGLAAGPVGRGGVSGLRRRRPHHRPDPVLVDGGISSGATRPQPKKGR